MAAPAQDDLPQYFQKDPHSQENKDLISTLPIEKGWIIPNPLLRYQGSWYTTSHLQGVLACQKHFQTQNADIFLVTVPKSGTTWFKAILFSLVNRLRYNPDPQQTQHPLVTNNPHVLVPFLELNLYIGKHLPDDVRLNSWGTPSRLFATHVPYVSLPQSVKDYSADDCKIVYLCRDPKDTFVSLWCFLRKMTPNNMEPVSLEEAFEKFCRGVSNFGPIWDHFLGYWKESLERPDKVLFVKYEEMKEQPGFHLRRLADFLGCPFSQDEEAHGMVDNIVKLCSFENLSNLDVNKSGKLYSGTDNSSFFRKGEAGGWRNYLTDDMVKRINSITRDKLQGSGLHF